jgi:cytochrome c-type biogenesis protein CcmF
MVANFGYGALVITLLVALYGVGAAIYGGLNNSQKWIESARLAMLLTWPLLTVTALCMVYLLVTGHYELAFVSSVTSNSMPIYLRITSLWGGQAGSLVFWSWLMSAFASAVTLRKWDRDREFLPWVIVVALVTLSFFLIMILFYENPFDRLWQTPAGNVTTAMFQPAGAQLFNQVDGRGLNPLLRHWGMIIHPPMLYLGFVSFVIPFAFAIAALVTGRTDDRWIRITRRWTLVAWLFLSLGLILGARWAYDVLGWGGYWGWDPVEIAAFLPWLTGTAFVHSVMIQEKRGMLKHWNMVLIILTYALVIFGTFLTRSGVLSSVHAFAQSAIGPLFFGFIGLTFIVSMGLLFSRWESLKSDARMTSLFSREALFLLNNLLFLSIAIVCFWGVIFPLISELITNQKITVGPPFYQRATAPLFAGLLLLMGVAPLSAWGKSTARTLGRALWKPFLFSLVVLALALIEGVRNPAALLGFWLCGFVAAVTLYEFWRGALARHRKSDESLPLALWRLTGRNRRRYGGYTVHLGIVLMAIGIIGSQIFQTQTQGTIPLGGSLTLDNYTITYKTFDNWDTADGRNVARATVSISKDGQYLGDLYPPPRRDFYYESQQPMTIPGIYRTRGGDDIYVLLVDWQPVSSNGATFKIYHNPLINWLWLGGFIFIFGILIAAWPDKDPETVRERVRRQAYSPAKA